MCGIVGLFGKITEPKIETFEEMFQIDVIRGSDSCGIGIIHNDSVNIVKDIVWPDELLATEEYEKLVWQQDVNNIKALIGHNRASTRGAVSQKNAHPFTHGNITMVHNGTVWTYKFPGIDKDTDSETICHSINERGIDKTWKLIDGAAVLVYWDDERKKLCIVGNGKRPMWFMEWGDNSESIFWASEPWMMLTASMRAGVKYNIKKLYPIDKDKLYEFEYVDGRVNYTSRKLDGYTELVTRSKATGYWHNNQWNSYGSYDEWGYGYDEVDPNEDRPHMLDCNCSECCAGRVAKYNDICRARFNDNDRPGEAEEDDNTESFPGEELYKPADSSIPDRGAILTIGSSRRVAALRIDVTHKRVDESFFKENYTRGCSCCGASLENEYTKAVILNLTTKDALCTICAAVGEYRPQPGATIPLDKDSGATVTCH
jgi:hypothetical protein